MSSHCLLKHVNCKAEKKNIQNLSILLQLRLITGQGAGKVVGPQDWGIAGGAVGAGPPSQEPSHPL